MKEGTFYNSRVFSEWLLSADKTENQPATEQMETWEAPGMQAMNIYGRHQVGVAKGQFQGKEVIPKSSRHRQDKN